MGILQWWQHLVLRRALLHAQTKPLPEHLFTSPPQSLQNDTIVTYLSERPWPYRFRFTNVVDRGVEGDWYNENEQGGRLATIPWSSLPYPIFYAKHYYRGYEYEYSTPWQLLWAKWTQHAWRARIWDLVGQFFFNRRYLTRRDRVAVLRLFVEQTQRDRTFTTDSVQLMGQLYTVRSVRHPDFENLKNYYRLVLDSLADEGIVIHERFLGYKLEPKGVTVLQQAEEDDRRHADNVKLQRNIILVTIVLGVIAVAQAAITVWSELNPDPQPAPAPSPQGQLVYPISPPNFGGPAGETPRGN